MKRSWGGNAQTGKIYEYRAEHKDRMGNCDWLPEPGDMCICMEHAGDWFYYYVALRKQPSGQWKRVGKFGAYQFGELAEHQLSEKELNLALAWRLVWLGKPQRRLHLYVWENALCDYTCGMMVALATSPDHARKLLRKKLGKVPDIESKPRKVTRASAFYSYGGG